MAFKAQNKGLFDQAEKGSNCSDMENLSAPELKVEWKNVEYIQTIHDEWRELFHQAASPNVFFGPDFFLPLVDSLKLANKIRILLIWDDEELVAFLPVMHSGLKEKMFGIASLAFIHPISPCSLPLLHKTNTFAIAKTLIMSLQKDYPPGLAAFNGIVQNNRAVESLTKAAAHLGLQFGFCYNGWRAGLKKGLSSDAYIAKHVEKRHTRELQRRERRLIEKGVLEYKTYQEPSNIKEAFDAFLKLEADGWKGKQGSAMMCNPDHVAFGSLALTGQGSAPRVSIDTVSLDGRVIAVAINLITNRHIILYKSAYDETLSHYSPGVLCDLQTTRHILDSDSFDEADSNSTPGHPIERWWHDKIPFGNLRIALDSHIDKDFLSKLSRREKLWQQGVEWIKKIDQKIRNRKTVTLRPAREK
jgi:CelD/BcsL family acetyltransferase involved in cellulose biosynthesis